MVGRFGWMVGLLLAAGITVGEEMEEHYAESVMVGMLSEDGTEDLSLRLARFPGRGEAHVWMHVANGEGAWSVVDESFVTGDEATPVRADEASFAAHTDSQSITFASEDRNGMIQGRVTGNVLLKADRHVETGTGTIPATLDLKFEGGSRGYRSDTGRWELTGRLSGTIVIEGQTWTFDHDGKWHEQTGPRARFAPAFTYLNVQGQGLALLAIGFENGARGYVESDGEITQVTALEIDPVGHDSRDFTVTLADGRTVSGTARVVQRWSVPIEGKNRPGASIIADTNRGRLFGSLNDWDPEN